MYKVGNDWIWVHSACAHFFSSVFFTFSEGEQRYQLLPLSPPHCHSFISSCCWKQPFLLPAEGSTTTASHGPVRIESIGQPNLSWWQTAWSAWGKRYKVTLSAGKPKLSCNNCITRYIHPHLAAVERIVSKSAESVMGSVASFHSFSEMCK